MIAAQSSFHCTVRWIFMALLGGYLIFNKPFAQIGFPPLYIGEIVLALCLVVALQSFNYSFLEPLRLSWTFRVIAVFFGYGLIRACADYFTYGLMAFRDGAVAGYALLAFVAPAVLRSLDTAGGNRSSAVSRLLLIAGIAAGAWAACIQYNVFHLATVQTKVDYMTMAVAAGAWTCAMAAFKSRKPAMKITFLGLFALLSLLVLALPTRTVWLAAPPLGFVFIAAWMHTAKRQKLFFVTSALFAIVLGVLLYSRFTPVFAKWNQELALNVVAAENKNIEQDSTLKVDEPKKPPPDATSGEKRNAGERISSIFVPDETQFSTASGKLGAHAVKWRAVFWMRCWYYTIARAPLLGLGFGRNLTLLLRDTPAWPMYIDSMRFDPPNRSPHSAHVTIFSRLGSLGLLLWLIILASTFWNGLRACWNERSIADRAGTEESRQNFWDALTLLGVWTLLAWTMSFGVILEGPFGGIWFWTLSGVLVWSGIDATVPASTSHSAPTAERETTAQIART